MHYADYLSREDNFIKLYKFTCSLPKEQSYMLSYLIDCEKFVERGLAEDPDYFECCTKGFIDNLLTGWSEYEITKAINDLVNAGYIYKRVINKQRTYIKLNYDALDKLNERYKNHSTYDDESIYCNRKKVNTECKESYHPDVRKLTLSVKKVNTECIESYHNQEQINNNINNNINNILEGSKEPEDFKTVIEYLNLKANKNYRFNKESTNKFLRARFNEGYTIEDFKKVIDIKCNEWKNTDMDKYLRPETLFGTKFETYLNQKANHFKSGTYEVNKQSFEYNTTVELSDEVL